MSFHLHFIVFRVFLSAARKALKTRDAKLARLVNHLVSHVEDPSLRGRLCEKLRATDLTNGIVRHTPEPAYDNETMGAVEDVSTATSVTGPSSSATAACDQTGGLGATRRLHEMRASQEFCSQLALDQVSSPTDGDDEDAGGKASEGGGGGSGGGGEENPYASELGGQRVEDALWALRLALRRSERQECLPLVPILCSPGNQQSAEDQECGPLSADYSEGSEWIRGPLLGTGAFSNCYQARDKATGTLMAVKQVRGRESLLLSAKAH